MQTPPTSSGRPATSHHASLRLSSSVQEQSKACTCRWRNLSKDVYDQTVNESEPWYCFLNTGRENAGCDEPDDYQESAEQSMEII